MAIKEVGMKARNVLLSVSLLLGSILAASQAFAQVTPTHVPVPEPSTLAVLAACVGGLGALRWYMKKKK